MKANTQEPRLKNQVKSAASIHVTERKGEPAMMMALSYASDTIYFT
jgi:hypothetical protein